MRRITIVFLAVLLFCPFLSAQVADSRAGEIEAARAQKAQNLRPDEPTKVERAFSLIQSKLPGGGKRNGGFHLKYGGLVSGAGVLAIGPEYVRPDLAGSKFLFRGAALLSTRRYQKYDLQFTRPARADERYILDFYTVHRNFPSLGYYGPGPDSEKGGRSNFRLEDTAFSNTFGLRLAPHLYAGTSVGYLLVNVGPGTDLRFVSTEKAFTPVGIDRQANFLRHGVFIQYDYRDHPGGPRSGGNYIAAYSQYRDRTLDVHNFDRLELELRQYLPFFNERRVIALRGRSVLSFTDSGQKVPFYLQPTLGGADALRGYRSYRFYDDNMLVANAEYRWEAFSGLDLAVFADAGKIFPRRSQWNLHDLESSVGVGMRFNAFNDVLLRLDVGFSHEGFQFWIKLNDIFEDDPVRPPLTRTVF